MTDAFGTLIEPATLKIERRLPGPIERVWAFLTESDLRRQWLATGEMEMRVGASFELVWHNDELTTPPGHRPDGFACEHRLQSSILALDPPHLLAITFGNAGEVVFELREDADDVLLTVIHRRLPDREMMLKVSAGWHSHLDLLVARATGAQAEPYWDEWTRLQLAYGQRLPA